MSTYQYLIQVVPSLPFSTLKARDLPFLFLVCSVCSVYFLVTSQKPFLWTKPILCFQFFLFVFPFLTITTRSDICIVRKMQSDTSCFRPMLLGHDRSVRAIRVEALGLRKG